MTTDRRKRDNLLVTAIVASFLAIVAVGIVGYTTLHNRATISDVREISDRAAHLGEQIQGDRTRATRDACGEQNARHFRTIGKLNQVIAAATHGKRTSGAQAAQLAASEILSEAVPFQNCTALVAERVTKHSPKTR